MANVIARAQPADAGDRAQQDAGGPALQRVQGDFSPTTRCEYFVSYYDYYQPEAYVPSNRHLHREGLVDQRRDRQACAFGDHALAAERRDVVIVASVSCIYGLGSPEDYCEMSYRLRRGAMRRSRPMLRKLVDIQYQRNDDDFHARHVPRARRRGRDLSGLRGTRRCASSSSATRSSADHRDRSADAASACADRRDRHLPGQATT